MFRCRYSHLLVMTPFFPLSLSSLLYCLTMNEWKLVEHLTRNSFSLSLPPSIMSIDRMTIHTCLHTHSFQASTWFMYVSIIIIQLLWIFTWIFHPVNLRIEPLWMKISTIIYFRRRKRLLPLNRNLLKFNHWRRKIIRWNKFSIMSKQFNKNMNKSFIIIINPPHLHRVSFQSNIWRKSWKIVEQSKRNRVNHR